jgi:hypothetical protein
VICCCSSAPYGALLITHMFIPQASFLVHFLLPVHKHI